MSARSNFVDSGNKIIKEGVNLTEENDEKLSETSQLNESAQQSSESASRHESAEFEQLNINGSYELHKLVKVQEDASSLFNSLSYLVYGDISQGSLMRFFIVEHVGNNWKNFQQYVISSEGETKYSTKEEYMSEMLKSTTYGGGCELIAAGSVFPYCFEVYVDGTRYSIFGDSKKPIRRLRSSSEVENHYDAYEPNDEISMTVNKDSDKMLKRKMDCSEKKQESRNECKKVWKKKLKIEENPFATVWLVDNGSPSASDVNKKISQDMVGVSTDQEMCSTKSNSQFANTDAPEVKDASLIAVDTSNTVLVFKSRRGRPKKQRLFPQLNNHGKKEILLQERVQKGDDDEVENVKSDKILWAINLKKRPVGRPKGSRNSVTALDKSKKIHEPTNSLILPLGKKKRGRPRKDISLSNSELLESAKMRKIVNDLEEDLEVLENENVGSAVTNKNILNDSDFGEKFKRNHFENCDCSLCAKTADKVSGEMKKKRGRPKIHSHNLETVKRSRGRPKKVKELEEVPKSGTENVSDESNSLGRKSESNQSGEGLVEETKIIKRKRGRPKSKIEESEEIAKIGEADSNCDVIDDAGKVLNNPCTDLEEQSTSKVIPSPRPKLTGKTKSRKKKRGRPKKSAEISEATKPESDWYSFVEPLLSKSIIPLSWPGFTKPSDVPTRPMGRPRKSVLNEGLAEEPAEKIKRPRGRPKKVSPTVDTSEKIPGDSYEEEILETAKSSGDWHSFVDPLLSKAIIPLPWPGFTKSSDIPTRPKGRPRKSILNVLTAEKPKKEKIKKRRGRPRKVLPTLETSQSSTDRNTVDKNLDHSSVNFKEQSLKHEIVKRPRGRPKQISTPEAQTVEIVKKASKSLKKSFPSRNKSKNVIIARKSKSSGIKIKILGNSVVSLPGQLIKRPRGRPKKMIASADVEKISKKPRKSSKRNDSPSNTESTEIKKKKKEKSKKIIFSAPANPNSNSTKMDALINQEEENENETVEDKNVSKASSSPQEADFGTFLTIVSSKLSQSTLPNNSGQ